MVTDSFGTPCPICANEVEVGEVITVCDACHRALQASGAIAVNTTGEFPAFAQLERLPDATAPAAPLRPRTPTRPEAHACTWCEKTGDQVKKLLARGAMRICNECIALCSDILEAELGNDWR